MIKREAVSDDEKAPARKKALLVGVNRYQAVSPLNGCVNDAHHLGIILKALGFSVRLLADDRAHRTNIIERIKWLTNVPKGGTYFLGMSSHGTHVADRNGDEVDGQDECFCPYDLNPATWWEDGLIVDDEWVSMLPDDRTGFAFFDMCHSGTSLRELGPAAAAAKNHPVLNRAIHPPADVAFRAISASTPPSTVRSTLAILNKPVYYIGASQDSQTAADYFEPGCPICSKSPAMLVSHGSKLGYHGALSTSFITAILEAGGGVCGNDGSTITFSKGVDLSYKGTKKVIQAWFGKHRNFNQIPSFEVFGGLNAENPLPLWS
jgi:hypothetical protein